MTNPLSLISDSKQAVIAAGVVGALVVIGGAVALVRRFHPRLTAKRVADEAAAVASANAATAAKVE